MLERVVALAMFGLGTALGVEAVKAARGGVRPLVRDAFRVGIAATEMARSAASAAGRAVAEVANEARQEYEQEKAGTEMAGEAAHNPSKPRRIQIVRE